MELLCKSKINKTEVNPQKKKIFKNCGEKWVLKSHFVANFFFIIRARTRTVTE